MNDNKKVLTWFEIPVQNMERAVNFYQAVLGYSLERKDSRRVKMAIIAQGPEMSGGALVEGEGYVPAADQGVLIYLSVDVPQALQKVAQLGGKILVPEKPVEGDHGVFAVIQDSEGNRIGLHQYELSRI